MASLMSRFEWVMQSNTNGITSNHYSVALTLIIESESSWRTKTFEASSSSQHAEFWLCLFCWFQYLGEAEWQGGGKGVVPGMSTSGSHQHSSWRRHCRILHSSWEQRTRSPIDVLQKIRTHLPPPAHGLSTDSVILNGFMNFMESSIGKCLPIIF